MNALPPPPPVIEQLVRCGLKADGLEIAFDDLLQNSVVTVKAGAGGDSSMFTCIRHAVWGVVDIEFENEKLGHAYGRYDQAVGTEEVKAQAREWLAERGLLEKLPAIREGEAPVSIIEKVERFCSLKPGSALELYSPQFLTLKPSFIQVPPQAEFACLINVLMLLDLEKHGLKFGFIGNERYGDEQDENAQKN